jgi:hypothetical protein
VFPPRVSVISPPITIDARIPIVCVIRVHHPRLETAIEDLVTLASQIGLKFALVHDKSDGSFLTRRWREAGSNLWSRGLASGSDLSRV